MKYFDHDTDACKDELIQALRLECGGAAIDAYWTILEAIYRDETDLVIGENRPGTKALTYWLAIGFEELKTYILAMKQVGLVSVEESEDGLITVHSERATNNINAYREKCEKARQNGKKGGRKPKAKRKQTKGKPNANQSQSVCEDKEKEKEIVLVTHKGLPNTSASCVADAEETASHSAQKSTKPICPLCESPIRFDAKSMKWKCQTCGEINEPRYVDVVA